MKSRDVLEAEHQSQWDKALNSEGKIEPEIATAIVSLQIRELLLDIRDIVGGGQIPASTVGGKKPWKHASFKEEA